MSNNCWPKIWGRNSEIYNNDLCSVNVLHIRKGGTCSTHTHKSKHNVFYVLSGKLKIRTDIGNSIIGPDQSITVFAGTEHSFQAIENTTAIEVMFVKYEKADISRKTVGYLEQDDKKLNPEE